MPIHCDNTTAAGIVKDTVKKQRSQSMETRYFYVRDQVKQGVVDVHKHTSWNVPPQIGLYVLPPQEELTMDPTTSF